MAVHGPWATVAQKRLFNQPPNMSESLNQPWLQSATSSEGSSLPSGARCILLAEDDADDVFLLRRALLKTGLPHRLFDVSNGDLVVGYLSGRPPFDDRMRYPFPDLLLLDLKMPKRDGFDVLAWLKSRPDMDSLPVVVLTSSAIPEDRDMALRMGAREFCTKPSNSDDLIRLVRSLHERWLTQTAPLPQTLCQLSQIHPQIRQTC